MEYETLFADAKTISEKVELFSKNQKTFVAVPYSIV
jgi:hypothetical protein